jgi:hypothetical protein
VCPYDPIKIKQLILLKPWTDQFKGSLVVFSLCILAVQVSRAYWVYNLFSCTGLALRRSLCLVYCLAVAILKLLIILCLNLCFVNEDQWGMSRRNARCKHMHEAVGLAAWPKCAHLGQSRHCKALKKQPGLSQDWQWQRWQ